jgi:hypothetical protein
VSTGDQQIGHEDLPGAGLNREFGDKGGNWSPLSAAAATTPGSPDPVRKITLAPPHTVNSVFWDGTWPRGQERS